VTALMLHPRVTTEDIPSLPPIFQRQAVKILLALRDDPHAIEASVPLRASRVALDLTGCRSIRFGGEAYDDAFRVVFLTEGDEVCVLAVGRRQASEVFRAAQERLYPQPVRTRRRRTYLMDHNVPRSSGRRR